MTHRGGLQQNRMILRCRPGPLTRRNDLSNSPELTFPHNINTRRLIHSSGFQDNLWILGPVFDTIDRVHEPEFTLMVQVTMGAVEGCTATSGQQSPLHERSHRSVCLTRLKS